MSIKDLKKKDGFSYEEAYFNVVNLEAIRKLKEQKERDRKKVASSKAAATREEIEESDEAA